MMENKRKNKKQLEAKLKQTATTNWINYEDKIPILIPEVPNVNLVNANDMNSIKWSVMKGIPLFYNGQVMMFSTNLVLNAFLNKFNIVENVDYELIKQNRYFKNSWNQSPSEPQTGGRDNFTIIDRNLPTTDYFLGNNYNNSRTGELFYKYDRAGSSESSNWFPIVSGFWSTSGGSSRMRYSIRINPYNATDTIQLNPLYYNVFSIIFKREIFAEDIKKV